MLKNNDFGGTVIIITMIFTSLVISTLLISYFLLSAYGLEVASVELPHPQTAFSSSQDFTTNQINESIIDINNYGKWEYYLGIGKVLTQKSFAGWSYLLFKYIQKDDSGIITNYYHINNSVKQDYSVILRYNGGINDNELIIRSDGVHITKRYIGILTHYPLKFSYPNMNQIEDVYITTKFDDKNNKVNVIFNSLSFIITDFDSDINPFNLLKRYYGGVSTDTLGFTVLSFRSDNIISFNNTYDMLQQTAAFILIAFKLIVYNVDVKYLPWEMNIFLIKTQTGALLIAMLALWRGVG